MPRNDYDWAIWRRYGIKPDAVYISAAKQWTGTDNGHAIQAMIDDAPHGAVLTLPPGDLLSGALTIRKSITLEGNGQFGTRVIAALDSSSSTDSWLFMTKDTTIDSLAPWDWPHMMGGHIQGLNLRNILFDGHGRQVDMVGGDYRWAQHSHWHNVEFRHWARQGLWVRQSVREAFFDRVQVRYSGNGADVPGFDVRHTTGGDGHNNLWFTACEAVHNMGPNLAFGSLTDDPARNMFWWGGLIHGTDESYGAVSTNWYDYGDATAYPSISSDHANVVVDNGRAIHLSTRIHGWGPSHSAVEMRSVAGETSRCFLSLNGAEFGAGRATEGNGRYLVDLDAGADDAGVTAVGCENDDTNLVAVVNNPNNEPRVYEAANYWGDVPFQTGAALSTLKTQERIEGAKGFVTESADGTRWLVAVDNAGAVTTTAL